MSMEKNIMAAVAAVHAEFEAQGKKVAGSDKWHTHLRKFRPILVSRVIEHYCSISDTKEEDFPFNDDYVGRLYLTYRKGKARREKLARA